MIEAMGLDRPPLVGHFVPGPVVLTAAARHGSRVGPIVLCDSSGGFNGSDSMWRIIPRRFIDAVEELAFDLRATPDALFNAAHHPRACLHQFRLAKVSQARLAQRVHNPTLLAWGARGRTMPLRCARLIEKVMANATTHVSREGSHDWMIERADEFAGVVHALLTRCARETPSGGTIELNNYRATGTEG
jgi:pimeloyl-ACP methyl ester carboxylesterase